MADKEATLLLKVKETGSEAISGVTKFLLNLTNAIGLAKDAWEFLKGVGELVLGQWGEQETAINSLNQSLIQQGIYTKELSQSYIDMATALQRSSTYGDEQIVQAQAIMQGFLGQTTITKELMQATLDFATAKKMDLASAAEIVGKSIGTETNALNRYGVELKAGQSETERMALSIESLNNKFGGQASAAAQGMGAFQQLKNAISDLFEILGGKLAPIVIPIAQKITQLAYAIADSSDTTTALGKAMSVLTDIFTVTKGIVETFFNVIKMGFQELYSVFEAPLKAMGSRLQEFGSTVGDIFKTAFQYWKSDAESATSGVGKILGDGIRKINDEMKANDDKRLADIAASHAKEQAMAIEANARKREIDAQNNQIKLESFTTQKTTELENELALEQLRQDAIKNQSDIYTQQQINDATTKQEKLRMMQVNQTAFEQQQSNVRFQAAVQEGNLKKMLATEQVNTLQSSFSQIATMQNAHNKTMQAIGKAAAIGEIIINTARGISAAMAFPFIGPVLAGLVAASGAAQIATVAGVQLAEGGIVKARPGGIQATIGEGGQDEAVIPLGKGGSGGMMGTTVNMTVYGGILGTPGEAKEFAIAIDRELLKLRQGNESQAFDSSLV